MVKCPKCGKENREGAAYCIKCNQPLNNNQKDSRNNNKILIGMGIIVIIAIIGIVLASGALNPATNTPAVVVNNTSTNTTNTVVSNDSSNTSNAESSNVYVSSSKSNKFHVVTCEWAKKISENNKITYPSRQAALDGGKVPCSVCNP